MSGDAMECSVSSTLCRRAWLGQSKRIIGALLLTSMLSTTPIYAQTNPGLSPLEVRKYQGWLQHLGIYKGPVDGIYSKDFENGVLKYQRSKSIDWAAFRNEADALVSLSASTDLLKMMEDLKSSIFSGIFSLTRTEKDAIFVDIRQRSGFLSIPQDKMVGAVGFFMRGAVEVPVRIDPGVGYGLFYSAGLDLALIVELRHEGSYKVRSGMFVPGEVLRAEKLTSLPPAWTATEASSPLLARLKATTRETITSLKRWGAGSNPFAQMQQAMSSQAQAAAEARLLYMGRGVSNAQSICGAAMDSVSKDVVGWAKQAAYSNVRFQDALTEKDLDLRSVAGVEDAKNRRFVRIYAAKNNPYILFAIVTEYDKPSCRVEAVNAVNLYSFD